MQKRYFNTSGPNIPEEHYTLMRDKLIGKGMNMVERKRYFTIWAPRQTGKSTYFRQLANRLKSEGHGVTHINVENFLDISKESFLNYLCSELNEGCNLDISANTFGDLFTEIKKKQGNCVLIIDEIEGLSQDLFGQFLHTIRNLYHSREIHCLKSIILVGVSNIVGIVQDNASPFNIADNLEVPYFTNEEVYGLLGQHEDESGQQFDDKVKDKIYRITAGQPGLVNGFAYQLVEMSEGKKNICYEDYLSVEHWYLKIVIDKNVSNVVNKAKPYRRLVERLLFKGDKIEFDIERESIKTLHTNGVVKEDENGNVEFWVPLYKKKLYSAFYPFENGEGSIFFRTADFDDFFTKEGRINFDELISNFKEYVKRRSFKYFREKDETTGEYKQIKEAALVYAFETYIQYFLNTIGGKSYLEAHTGLGRTDLIVNYNGNEYIVEVKIFRDSFQYKTGKKQLAYYCNSLNVKEGVYLVFVPQEVERVEEGTEEIEGVAICTYIVKYDEEKDF